MFELKRKPGFRLVRKDEDENPPRAFTPVVSLTPQDSGFGRTAFMPATPVSTPSTPVSTSSTPVSTPTGSGYVPSYAPNTTLSVPPVSSSSGYVPSYGQTNAGTAARTAASTIAPAVNYLKETGQQWRDAATGTGIADALRGKTATGGTPSPKFQTYLSLMTPEEQAHARTLTGWADQEKLGQYVSGLNLEARFSDAEKEKRAERITQAENSTRAAKPSDSSQGRLIATWVTGNSQYAARDYLGTDPGDAPEKFRFLTDAQRKTFLAYIEAGDFAAVARYYDDVEWELNAKQAERTVQNQAWAGKSGANVAASAVTSGLLNAVAGIPAYGSLLFHKLGDAVKGTYTPVDYNAEAFTLPRMSQAQQEAAQGWLHDENNLRWADENQRRLLSDVVYSGTSSAITNLVQLYAGSALGLSGNALAEFITAEMGVSAGGQAAYQNLREGQSSGDALANATVSGLIEYGTEHLFISDYLANLGAVKGAIYAGNMKEVAVRLLKTRASRAGAEALEEVVGNIAEQTWDALYNGNNSEWSRRVEQILAAKREQTGQEPTKEDSDAAQQQAFMDLYVQQSVTAALSAAFSTLLMDGVPAAVDAASSRVSFSQAAQRIRADGNIQNEIDKGKLWKPDSLAYKQAVKVEEQLKGGTTAVKNQDLGRLAFLVGQETQNLILQIEDSGSEEYRREAVDILAQAAQRGRSQYTDKLTVGELGTLRTLMYSARNPLSDAEIRTLRSSLVPSDSDGNPLPTFQEFMEQSLKVWPDLGEEEGAKLYGQALANDISVTIDGEYMNFTKFWQRVQETDSSVTPEQAAQIFDRLLTEQLTDGMDAGERIRLAEQQGQAVQRQSVERSRERLESLLKATTSVKGLVFEDTGMAPEENAYVDSAGIVHLNAARVDTEGAMQYVLGHELVHSVTDPSDRAALVRDILDTAQRVNGLSDETIADMVETQRKNYQKHEDALAKREGREAREISVEYAREELAADMMRDLVNGNTLEKLAGARPSWFQRMTAKLREMIPALRNTPEAQELQRLETRFVDTLRTAPAQEAESIPAQATQTEQAAAGRADAAQDAAGEDVTRKNFTRAYAELSPSATAEETDAAWSRFNRDGATVLFRDDEMDFPRFWNALRATSGNSATRTEAAAAFARLLGQQEDSGRRYSLEDAEDTGTRKAKKVPNLTEQIRNAIPDLKGMDSVANVSGNEIPTEGKIVDRLSSFVKSFGSKVNRPGFGDVLFSRGKIKSATVGHGVGQAKIDLFAAVPAVIQRGKQIGYVENYDQRVYDTYVFAAPVDYKGKPVYVGVVVLKSKADNRYYVHEAVDSDGNLIIHEKDKEAASDGRATQTGAFDTVATSKDNIPHPAEEVKGDAEDNPGSSRFSITPEFADWFEAQTGEKLAVSRKYLDSAGKPVYDSSRTVDDRAGVMELARQARALQQRLDYWKGQTRLSTRDTVVLKRTGELAKKLLASYDSTLTTQDIEADVAELAGLFLDGPKQAAPRRETATAAGDAESEAMATLRQEAQDRQFRRAWEAELRRRAGDIAGQVVKSSRVLIEGQDVDEIKEIRKRIREARISYEAEKGDIADFNDFRKRYFGRLNLTKAGHSIDVYWDEWQELFGKAYFPDALSTADMILHVAELLDRLTPAYENPYSANMTQAIDACTTDLLQSVMDADWSKNLTAADRQRAREEVSAARLRDIARKAVQRERELGKKRLRAYKEEQQKRAKDRTRRSVERENREKLEKVKNRLANKKLSRVNQRYRAVMLGELSDVSEQLTGMDIAKLADLLQEHAAEMDPASETYNPEFLRGRVQQLLQEKKNAPETDQQEKPGEKKEIPDMTPEEIQNLLRVLQAFEFELRNADKLLEEEDRRTIQTLGSIIIDDIRNAAPWGNGLPGKIGTAMLSPERFARRVTGYAKDDPLQNLMHSLTQGQEREHDYSRRAFALVDRVLEAQGYGEKAREALKRSLSGQEAAKEKNLIQISAYSYDAVIDKSPARAEEGADTPLDAALVDVRITKGMRVALYLAGKNEDNLRHMEKGGLKIPSWEYYRKGDMSNAYDKGKRVRLTKAQIDEITSHMTPEELAFAEAVHRYYDGMSKNELADTQEKLVGWSNMSVENYFPIQTDTNFTQTSYEDMRYILRDGTVTNPGWTKSRVDGDNPIMLRDANLVLEQSIRQHAKFIGTAIPIRNLAKVMRMQNVSADRTYNDSFMNALGNVFGTEAKQYLTDLLQDLQTGRRGTASSLSRLLTAIQGNYAGAVLTGNLSVALKQAASFPTAAAVLDPDALAKALLPGKDKVDLNLIAAYTSHLWYRSQGYSSQELGDLANRRQSAGEKLTDIKVLNIIQGMDVWTTTRLWKAAEYHVEKHFPELAHQRGTLAERRRGDSPFYKKVAEVYNQVIEETQPNYSSMLRPAILRENSDLVRALTMFKTQPFQNFNILYDALGERAAQARAYRNDPTQERRDALTLANRKAARAIASQFASGLVFSLIQYLWDAFRRKDKKYKDEEGELTPLTWTKAIGVNMTQNAFGMLPFASELFAMMGTIADTFLKAADKDPFFDTTFYGFDVSVASALTDTVTDAGSLVTAVLNVQAAMDEGKKPDWRKLGQKLYKSAVDFAQFQGIPIENFRKQLWAVGQQITVLRLGNTMGEYALLGITTDKDLSPKEYYALLFRAGGGQLHLNPDAKETPEEYRTLYKRMLQDGFDADTIQKKMRELFQQSRNFERVQADFSNLLNREICALDGYGKLDGGEREKLAANVKTASRYTTLRRFQPEYSPNDTEKWVQTAVDFGETWHTGLAPLTLLRSGTSGITGLKDEGGNTITNSKGLRVMERVYNLMPEVDRWSDDKRTALFEFLGVGKNVRGYRSAEVAAELKGMGNP